MSFIEAIQGMIRRIGILIVIYGCWIIGIGIVGVLGKIDFLPIPWIVISMMTFLIGGLGWLIFTGYREGAFVTNPHENNTRLCRWILVRIGVPIGIVLVLLFLNRNKAGFGVTDIILGTILAISGLWIMVSRIPSMEAKGEYHG